MGLDISHDCWHGAYSAFHRWRAEIAHVAGLPPIELMDGFYQHAPWMAAMPGGLHDAVKKHLPIKWECLREDAALHELLRHSDCDGEIAAEWTGLIADRLQELLPLLPDGDDFGHIGNWRVKTQKFIDGLRKAAAAGEAVRFH